MIFNPYFYLGSSNFSNRYPKTCCQLIDADFVPTPTLKEIKTSTWVSNSVIIPKKNTNIRRVCVDYTALNKHCPKDPFPLPRIDQIIDSTAGCARLSFLDAYTCYNQIKLKVEDKENSVHYTIWSLLLPGYVVWLKNTGATYQWMMPNCLGK
jgi:hypothetical protein